MSDPIKDAIAHFRTGFLPFETMADAIETLQARTEKAEAEAAALRDVLRGYEAWEASIILDADWSNATPLLTQGQLDQMIELQSQRNAALAKDEP